MSREALGIVFMRVVIGIWFLWSGVPKLKPAYFNEQMEGMLRYFAEEGAFHFYKGFLLWAAGHAKIFAFLTSVGEVAVGAALILGFLTPAAALAAIFMCVNYFLAVKNLGPSPIGVNFLCIAIGISLIVGRAGRYLSLDSKIFRKPS
jgi:uncharacterized membrane protein YphA (DoxX/SURF4 family)